MKQKIREEILKKRNNTDREERNRAGIAIMEKVLALPAFKNAETVFVYAAVNSEVDTCRIIDAALKAGKTVGLPRVSDGRMDFYGISDPSDLHPGFFSIPEPGPGCPLLKNCDLMIMPGVAFDEDRHRIGYGGGYYDRYLGDIPGDRSLGGHASGDNGGSKARAGVAATAAIAFELQICPAIPAEETDISPDLIITEERIIGEE